MADEAFLQKTYEFHVVNGLIQEGGLKAASLISPPLYLKNAVFCPAKLGPPQLPAKSTSEAVLAISVSFEGFCSLSVAKKTSNG